MRYEMNRVSKGSTGDQATAPRLVVEGDELRLLVHRYEHLLVRGGGGGLRNVCSTFSQVSHTDTRFVRANSLIGVSV